jgi:predicted permease
VTVAGAGAAKLAESLADSTRSGTGSRRHVRFREALIVVQVAFTLVLLTGAALLGRSLMSVTRVDPGYSLDDGLIVGLTIASDGSTTAQARQVAFQDALMERLRSQPGVSQVGLISAFPLGVVSAPNGMFIEMTRPDEITSGSQFNLLDPVLKSRAGTAEYRLVAADYFKAMRIPVLQGRAIDDRDTASRPPVAVVSESLARLQWPDRSPLGRWIQFGNMDGDFRAIEVVGVVGDVREVSPESQPDPTLYVSARQRPRFASRASLIIRGPSAAAMADTARRIIQDLDPEVPAAITTVSNALDQVLGSRRFTLWLVGAFGLTALVLATLGMYGLLAFTVSQRTREMGIRLALGAEPRSLVWLVARRGALLAGVGAIVGIVISRVSAGALEGLLYGVTAADPSTLAAAAAFLLAASMAATYAPARRILKQTPGRTLRDI